MLRQFRIATALLTLLAIAGCGIKGPLVLPPPAPAAATAPAATTAPAPTPPATTAPSAADSASSKPAAAERKP
jgi:diaminopimelate decarboxylase